MFAGFAWSFLIAPMVVLTLWLGANFGLLVLHEWQETHESFGDGPVALIVALFGNPREKG